MKKFKKESPFPLSENFTWFSWSKKAHFFSVSDIFFLEYPQVGTGRIKKKTCLKPPFFFFFFFVFPPRPLGFFFFLFSSQKKKKRATCHGEYTASPIFSSENVGDNCGSKSTKATVLFFLSHQSQEKTDWDLRKKFPSRFFFSQPWILLWGYAGKKF